jgi:Uma2 family endonuclease
MQVKFCFRLVRYFPKATREDLAVSLVERIATDAETRMVLENIAWETYVALADQRRGSVPRLTFDCGVLELMSPKREHENIACLAGRIVETYSEVKNIDVISLASVTVKRSDLSKAFEADESYYVANAVRLLAKKELDFETDPPPDLVIEVELTSSAIRKMDLFAAMQVPEIWRHDGETLQMFQLVEGSYQRMESSLQLPGLTSQRINGILALRDSVGETRLIQQFRKSAEED